jgi:hypothetical protein
MGNGTSRETESVVCGDFVKRVYKGEIGEETVSVPCEEPQLPSELAEEDAESREGDT